jgi:hypothetical protein
MEWADETCSRCLLVSSQDSAHLKTVIAMLHDHGIQTEEGLHRPWRSASFESSVMVAPEDFFRASVLYKELDVSAGIEPSLVPNSASSMLLEPEKRRLSLDFFAKPKQPKATDLGRYLKNRASS